MVRDLSFETLTLHFAFMTKLYSVSPAPTVRYCDPSSSYVIGALVMEAPRFACQSGSPVVAFRATRLFDGSPAKSRLPAVLRSPERPPVPSHLWLQRILPVL